MLDLDAIGLGTIFLRPGYLLPATAVTARGSASSDCDEA